MTPSDATGGTPTDTGIDIELPTKGDVHPISLHGKLTRYRLTIAILCLMLLVIGSVAITMGVLYGTRLTNPCNLPPATQVPV